MEEEIALLKQKAEEGRILYKQNKIIREEAKQHIIPYINEVNNKSKEIAKKYGQKPRLVNFNSFIR